MTNASKSARPLLLIAALALAGCTQTAAPQLPPPPPPPEPPPVRVNIAGRYESSSWRFVLTDEEGALEGSYARFTGGATGTWETLGTLTGTAVQRPAQRMTQDVTITLAGEFIGTFVGTATGRSRIRGTIDYRTASGATVAHPLTLLRAGL